MSPILQLQAIPGSAGAGPMEFKWAESALGFESSVPYGAGGVDVGDLLVFVGADSTGNFALEPSGTGWTSLETTHGNTVVDAKIATSTEAAASSLSLSNGDRGGGVLLCYSNPWSSTMTDMVSVAAATNRDLDYPFGGSGPVKGSGVQPNCQFMFAAGRSSLSGSWTFNDSSGWTDIADVVGLGPSTRTCFFAKHTDTGGYASMVGTGSTPNAGDASIVVVGIALTDEDATEDIGRFTVDPAVGGSLLAQDNSSGSTVSVPAGTATSILFTWMQMVAAPGTGPELTDLGPFTTLDDIFTNFETRNAYGKVNTVTSADTVTWEDPGNTRDVIAVAHFVPNPLCKNYLSGSQEADFYDLVNFQSILGVEFETLSMQPSGEPGKGYFLFCASESAMTWSLSYTGTRPKIIRTLIEETNYAIFFIVDGFSEQPTDPTPSWEDGQINVSVTSGTGQWSAAFHNIH